MKILSARIFKWEGYLLIFLSHSISVEVWLCPRALGAARSEEERICHRLSSNWCWLSMPDMSSAHQGIPPPSPSTQRDGCLQLDHYTQPHLPAISNALSSCKHPGWKFPWIRPAVHGETVPLGRLWTMGCQCFVLCQHSSHTTTTENLTIFLFREVNSTLGLTLRPEWLCMCSNLRRCI